MLKVWCYLSSHNLFSEVQDAVSMLTSVFTTLLPDILVTVYPGLYCKTSYFEAIY